MNDASIDERVYNIKCSVPRSIIHNHFAYSRLLMSSSSRFGFSTAVRSEQRTECYTVSRSECGEPMLGSNCCTTVAVRVRSLSLQPETRAQHAVKYGPSQRAAASWLYESMGRVVLSGSRPPPPRSLHHAVHMLALCWDRVSVKYSLTSSKHEASPGPRTGSAVCPTRLGIRSTRC